MPAADPARLRVAVVGLGSIGGAAAASLAHAGRHDVTVCARRPLGRLVAERPDGTADVAVRCLTDPADAAPVDWVLVVTKVHETPGIAPWLARLCDTATRVAVLQNGIDHVERLEPLVGAATVVPVIVYYNGERLGPGHVRMRRAGADDLAVRDDADGRAFARLMDGTHMRVAVSGDFRTLLWRKLLLNAVANPVTALTSLRQAVFRRADIHAQCMAILEEAVAVACADGAVLAPDEAARTMAVLLTYPPEAGTSMYFDRVAGRPFEVEALTGAIVAAGDRLGVPVPLNRLLLALLRAVSDAA